MSYKEADTAIIAGMGGGLIVDILKRGKPHTDVGVSLILQPQSEPERVRKYLYDLKYVINDEIMLVDDGKYYVVMKAVPGDFNKPYSDAELLYGRVLIKRKDAVLRKFLLIQAEKNNGLINSLKTAGTDNALNKINELKYEAECIKEALDTMSI